MAATKIDIQKAINPKWLIENRYTVKLPPNKVHKVRTAAIIWNNTPGKKIKDRIDMFLRVTEGIEKRTLMKYKLNNFAFNQTNLGKKLYTDPELLESFKKESFTVEVIENDSELVRYHFRVNLKKAEEFNIIKPEKVLDTERIARKRDIELEKPACIIVRTQEQRELVGRNICESIATGIYNVYEACEKYNIRIRDFAQWYGTNEYIKQMYIEACLMAKFFNSSRQVSGIDKMVNELLITGYTEVETINFSKIQNQFAPEGIWVEDRKTVTKRQIDEKGLALLKQTIQDVTAPTFGLDELDSMEDAELAKKSEEIQKRINRKLNK